MSSFGCFPMCFGELSFGGVSNWMLQGLRQASGSRKPLECLKRRGQEKEAVGLTQYATPQEAN
jgi:hypothetical protein